MSKMIVKIAGILLVGIFLLFFTIDVRAEYVLPYPSYMPGHPLYRISRILDNFNKWWYWGNIARVKYYLKLADKYIIEAKTLIEYKQYLLAAGALARSNNAIVSLPVYLEKAKNESKDITTLRSIINDAVLAHEKILFNLSVATPENILWTPEKSQPTQIHLSDLLNQAIILRTKIKNKINNL